jgi:hypothetical protein
MPEEVSPESKLYVKEEIEKSRKEIKEEVEKVNSKATKTFTTVAIVVGLITGLGVYGSATHYISATIQKKLGTETLAEIEKNRIQANNSYKNITDIKAKADKILSQLLKSFDQVPETNGHAWVGDILFQWGTVRNSDDPTTYEFPRTFPKECFSVVLNVKRTAGRTAAIHIAKWSKKGFFIDRANDIDGWMDVNYIAIGH